MDLPKSIQDHLATFRPRSYQMPVCLALPSEGGKHHKVMFISPRRSGKDFCLWACTVRAALSWRIGLYLYCAPTFGAVRSIIWEGMDNKGKSFLDYIPKELILKVRQDTMTIDLVNGSKIRCIGSDTFDRSIVGSNPVWIVFSEYAQCDENAFKLAALPIIKANGGVVAMVSTPRGKNHMHDLYKIALTNPDDWFTQFLTVEDTKHISVDEIKKDIETGEISEDLALQEYWCSFEFGQEGSIYNKHIDKMRLEGRLGPVPHDPYQRVSTAWDLGIKDPTCIVFFTVQRDGSVHIIDYYEASDKPMDHFASVVLSKPYLYQYHFPPHDVMQRESARGLTKREMYKELGIKFTEPVEIGIDDGIELVRRTLSRVWIDEVKCAKLIKAMENYREEFDSKRKIYKGRPLHDWASHAADAMRYLCAALPKAKDSNSSAEELELRYQRARYGGPDAHLPEPFRKVR